MKRTQKKAPRAKPARVPASLAIGAILALFAVLVLWNSFLCDDAFISFRYADNLIHGHGLVFNVGERVEGYTNFLWVVLLAGAMKLGAAPETWSRGLALLFSLGTLLLFLRHVQSVTKENPSGYVFPLLLAVTAPFYIWTTGGLETAAYAFFLFAGISSLLRARETNDTRFFQVSSLCFLASALTRPEGNFLFGLSLLYLLVLTIRKQIGLRQFVSFLLPFVVLGALYFWWRWSYYGKLLPNTFYVKTPGAGMIGFGGQYLLRFVWESWIWLPLVFVAVRLVRTGKVMWSDRLSYLASLVVVYSAYVVMTGGDFMVMSRFMMPMAAPILLLLHELLWSRQSPRQAMSPAWVMAALILVYGLGNGVVSYHSHRIWHTENLDSIGTLDDYYHKWTRVGLLLKQNSLATDTVATSAAGCVPYYSRLYTIDMLGLVAPDLAQYQPREGVLRPGHSVVIKPERLLELKPQFLLGSPRVEDSVLSVFPLTGLESVVTDLKKIYYPSTLEVGVGSGQYLNLWVRRDIAKRIPQRMRIYQ